MGAGGGAAVKRDGAPGSGEADGGTPKLRQHADHTTCPQRQVGRRARRRARADRAGRPWPRRRGRHPRGCVPSSLQPLLHPVQWRQHATGGRRALEPGEKGSVAQVATRSGAAESFAVTATQVEVLAYAAPSHGPDSRGIPSSGQGVRLSSPLRGRSLLASVHAGRSPASEAVGDGDEGPSNSARCDDWRPAGMRTGQRLPAAKAAVELLKLAEPHLSTTAAAHNSPQASPATRAGATWHPGAAVVAGEEASGAGQRGSAAPRGGTSRSGRLHPFDTVALGGALEALQPLLPRLTLSQLQVRCVLGRDRKAAHRASHCSRRSAQHTLAPTRPHRTAHMNPAGIAAPQLMHSS